MANDFDEPKRYLTDDHDFRSGDRNELVIFQGGNGELVYWCCSGGRALDWPHCKNLYKRRGLIGLSRASFGNCRGI